LTESKALKELKKGSEEALVWFIEYYTPYVSTVIQNIVGQYLDVSDIEELASDVFYTLWTNAKKVYAVKGFLGTVARNKAKNRLRDLSYDLPLDDQILIVDTLTPESQIEEKELSLAVRRAVLSMPQPEKEIFLRFYYYSQTIEHISQEMGINLSTVKTKLRRGRIHLGNTLKRYLQ